MAIAQNKKLSIILGAPLLSYREWSSYWTEPGDKNEQRTRKTILSLVRGSVTNNNEFWIRWLDLLTHSFTIS
jgi:hypothetical protein